MPCCNTYHLTWVSLTLGLGYLFMAAPAKHSRCALPWTRGISLPPPFLTFNVGYSSRLSCARTPPGPRPWPRAWVAPPSCCPWPWAPGGSSASLPGALSRDGCALSLPFPFFHHVSLSVCFSDPFESRLLKLCPFTPYSFSV